MLQNIIPSKTRRKILSLFFQNVNQSFHLRKVAREVGEEINAVKRELDILEKEGVLKKEKRLNKVIFSLNNKYLYYNEFLSIFIKQGDLAQKILKNLSKIGKIKYAAVSYKFAKKQKISENEIYLLLVGLMVSPEVVKIISEEEKKYGSEINYTLMNEEEFNFRKKNNDPFIWGFLKQPKIMIVGEESELMK
jgi:DNA-binding transcriptional ArsR family regulator